MGLLLTDVTRGSPGNDERLAFVFDLRRVKPSGLACELVVPEEWLSEIASLFVEGYCPTDEEVARENTAESLCGPGTAEGRAEAAEQGIEC